MINYAAKATKYNKLATIINNRDYIAKMSDEPLIYVAIYQQNTNKNLAPIQIELNNDTFTKNFIIDYFNKQIQTLKEELKES